MGVKTNERLLKNQQLEKPVSLLVLQNHLELVDHYLHKEILHVLLDGQNMFVFKDKREFYFNVLDKHAPETKAEKKNRLLAAAKAKADGAKAEETQKPNTVKYGIKHITALIEQKKATLVLIAHDVDPLEIVIWLPALCRKMGVPYAIVKGKARLGQVVHKKTATALAFTTVNKDDRAEFSKVVDTIKTNFLDRYDELRRQWGGGRMGAKSNARRLKREKAIAQETLPGGAQ